MPGVMERPGGRCPDKRRRGLRIENKLPATAGGIGVWRSSLVRTGKLKVCKRRSILWPARNNIWEYAKLELSTHKPAGGVNYYVAAAGCYAERNVAGVELSNWNREREKGNAWKNPAAAGDKMVPGNIGALRRKPITTN